MGNKYELPSKSIKLPISGVLGKLVIETIPVEVKILLYVDESTIDVDPSIPSPCNNNKVGSHPKL
jgi:hypothetical protein